MAHLPFELPPIALRPENFGATGNGTTDDAAAIQRCIDAAGARGTVQFTPGKTYRINSGLTCVYDEQTWLCWGARFTVNFSGVGVTIGIANPSSGTQKVWKFQGYGGEWRRFSHSYADGNVGIRFLNTNMSGWEGVRVRGFEKGLELLGDGGTSETHIGQQYGTFSIDEIGYCKHPIALIAKRGGWCNGNYLYGGGRVGYYGDGPDATGGYAIYMDRETATTEHVINQNTFVGLALEDAMSATKPAGAVRMMCQDCLFLGVRTEGFVDALIDGNNVDWEGNIWIGGTEMEEPATSITHYSGGVKSFFLLQYRMLFAALGGETSDKGAVFRNRGGTTTGKVLSIEQSDGVERIALLGSGYVVQKTAGNYGNGMGPIFTGTAEVDFGEIAAGASAVAEVTPSGLGGTGVNQSLGIQGDPVTVGATPYTAGISYTAQVKTNFGAVEVRATNHTGSPITLDNITLKVKVEKFNIG